MAAQVDCRSRSGMQRRIRHSRKEQQPAQRPGAWSSPWRQACSPDGAHPPATGPRGSTPLRSRARRPCRRWPPTHRSSRHAPPNQSMHPISLSLLLVPVLSPPTCLLSASGILNESSLSLCLIASTRSAPARGTGRPCCATGASRSPPTTRHRHQSRSGTPTTARWVQTRICSFRCGPL